MWKQHIFIQNRWSFVLPLQRSFFRRVKAYLQNFCKILLVFNDRKRLYWLNHMKCSLTGMWSKPIWRLHQTCSKVHTNKDEGNQEPKVTDRWIKGSGPISSLFLVCFRYGVHYYSSGGQSCGEDYNFESTATATDTVAQFQPYFERDTEAKWKLIPSQKMRDIPKHWLHPS